MLVRSLVVARSLSRAWRMTLYSSPRSRNVVTMREPIIVSSVRPTAVNRHAEVAGAIAIHRDANLRLAGVKIRVEVGEAGILRRLRQHDVTPSRQLFVFAAAEHDLHWIARAAHTQAARHADVYSHADQMMQTLAHALRDLLRRLVAFVPITQVQKHRAAVDVRAAAAVAAASEVAAHRCPDPLLRAPPLRPGADSDRDIAGSRLRAP